MHAFGFLLAILVGVFLGFFGGGGSILTVPLLVYVFGLDPKVAIASSLLVVCAASLSGVLQHWRAGRVRPRTGLVFGGAGMAGAYLGGRTAAFVEGEILLLLFAAVMVLTALAMWRGRRTPAVPETGGSALAKLAGQGAVVGAFTGLVGAGGGFLIVPALALWAGLPMPAAVGTSLFIIVLNTLAGFSGYVSHVRVEPGLVAAVAGCAIAGSFVGSGLVRVVEPASLRRSFAGFVFVMAAIILVREGALVAETATAALPHTLPQLVFALALLAVGIGAGRVSRPAPENTAPEATYSGGGGI